MTRRSLSSTALLRPGRAALAAVALGALAPARAEVRLPRHFGDHMVLQRDRAVPVWGWAEPGERVIVRYGDLERRAVARRSGAWRVELPPLAGGGSAELVVRGTNEIVLADVAVGEVWLCAGETAAALGMALTADAEEALASADLPDLRLFHVWRDEPAVEGRGGDPTGQWLPASRTALVTEQPGTLGGFSAAGYFLGRELTRALEVPVGIVACSWPDSKIEAWSPPAGWVGTPGLEELRDRVRAAAASYRRLLRRGREASRAWERAMHAASFGVDPGQQPGALYETLVAPLSALPLRGVLWLQGESNRDDGILYAAKLRALVESWRAAWGDPELAFVWLELLPSRAPGTERLPSFREAQAACLGLASTGMVVLSDRVAPDDAHGRDERELGRRAALWALGACYGRSDVVGSGPRYRSMEIDAGTVLLSFDHVGGGLVSRDGGALTCFQIAGADHRFVPASAVIAGERVAVFSAEVPEPLFVRFAWHRAARPNLANADGLPAAAFRTGL